MNRLRVLGGLLLGLALLAVPAQAQNGSARGRVVDAEGSALPEAVVSVKFLGERTWNFEAKTNENGEYIQAGLYPGRYRITVTKEGYETTAIEREIRLGPPTEIPDVVVQKRQTEEDVLEIVRVDLREKFTRAVELTRAGELDEAEVLFKELLDTMSDVAEIHQNLGYVYSQQEDWARAEASYLQALELDPGDSAIVSGLAKVYEKSGQDEKALALVSKTAQENPEDAVANYNRGVYLLNLGQAPGAIEAFQAALGADPGLTEAHYHVGTLLIGQGKVPEAVEHLEAYLASNPEDEQKVATSKGLLEALKQ